MNLNDFEEQIDPKIIDRGYGYFLEDLVDGPELIEEGVRLAMVYGTESYRVEIHTDPEKSHVIKEWRCDCHYDYGPVCKHVVAVLYVMTETEITEPDFAQQTGRKNYRQVAGWLRKMIKITGGDERAYSLFKKLLREYSNRPAMKEELKKAFSEW